MSTIVYDLYRYTGGDVAQLLTWLKQLRIEYMRHIKATINQFSALAGDSGKLYDRLMHDTQAGYRSPFNVDGSACIYLHEGRCYVHFFASQTFLSQYIEKSDVLVDCHYQD